MNQGPKSILKGSRSSRPKGNNLGGRMKQYYADKAKREAEEAKSTPRKSVMIETDAQRMGSFAVQFEKTPTDKPLLDFVPKAKFKP